MTICYKNVGGYYDDEDHEIYYDDILEFDPLTGQWELVGRMRNVRRDHALAVVNFSQVAQFCN